MSALEPFFVVYIGCWTMACLVALVLVLKHPSEFELTSTAYRHYLQQPWKLATFIVAAAGITVIAPYTGDPTWDYFDAAVMSLLTFATAPWAVGTLYRAARRQARLTHAYVALCAMLFSASWCYDIYLVYRDGDYPLTWWSNLAASSILYVLAGMLWSLEWRTGRGVTFGFVETDWPNPLHACGSAKIAWIALPIMLLVSVMILSFLWTSGSFG